MSKDVVVPEAPLSSSSGDPNPDVDTQLQELLQEAGLDSVPIDPASLQALKELVANGMPLQEDEKKDNLDYDNNDTMDSKDSLDAPPPISMVVASTPRSILKRATSELTQPGGGSPFTPAGFNNFTGIAVDDNSTAATAGSMSRFDPMGGGAAIEGATPVESRILDQLNMQTQLLLGMHQRIEDLTATVRQLQTNGGGNANTDNNNGGGISIQQATQWRTPNNATSTTNPTIKPAPQAAPAPRPTTAAIPEMPRGRAAAPGFLPPDENNNVQPRGFLGGVRSVRNGLRNSRLVKIFALFLALRRRHVQELDGGLIFKVLFMMAVLTARMSNSKRSSETLWVSNFVIVAFIVLVGFLVQTGYMKYFYLFFFKENYPGRIWDGEDITEQQAQQQILQRQHPHLRNAAAAAAGNNNDNNINNNNPDAAANGYVPPPPQENRQLGDPQQPGVAPAQPPPERGWRDTFLGGGIPEHAPDQPQGGGIVAAMQDVALLVGSFVLSIFPMWQPEAVPRGGGAAAAAAMDQGPGQVRPPPNALQPADDDDDDGWEEDDANVGM